MTTYSLVRTKLYIDNTFSGFIELVCSKTKPILDHIREMNGQDYLSKIKTRIDEDYLVVDHYYRIEN